MALPKLVILDVGHGSASALIDGAECCLFDGGRGTTLSEFLEEQKLNSIKAIYVSHADDDHVAGITTLLLDESISIGALFVNPAQKKETKAWTGFRIALSIAKQRGMRIVAALHSGLEDIHSCGSLAIKVVAPSAELILGGTALDGKKLAFNSTSVVLAVYQKEDCVAVVAGDLDDRGFADLKRNYKPFACEILVYPHHGGVTANAKTKEYAAELSAFFSPKLVVFSIGRGVEATPRPEIVDQLRQSSDKVRIICTQLSEHCAAKVPAASPDHLSDLPSKGRSGRECCGGSLVFELNGLHTLDSHLLSTHDIFVASLPSPLCKRTL
jgi:competence protein ComEC